MAEELKIFKQEEQEQAQAIFAKGPAVLAVKNSRVSSCVLCIYCTQLG